MKSVPKYFSRFLHSQTRQIELISSDRDVRVSLFFSTEIFARKFIYLFYFIMTTDLADVELNMVNSDNERNLETKSFQPL